MAKRKYNIHDWSLLILGAIGTGLTIFGLVAPSQNNCDSQILGVKSNDTVIVGVALMAIGIGYKSIVKFLQNKFGGAKNDTK